MIPAETLQAIEQEAKKLFELLETEALLAVQEQKEGGVLIQATMQEPQLFIGEKGQALMEIQHVLRMMLRKKLAEYTQVFLDINEYKKSKESYLKEMARNAADEVALLKKDKELPPMNAADRRVVHIELSQRSDVVAESVGQDPERRIVIRAR
ncbi:MAG: hypothetical protein HYT50_02550 [Candidatus Wildermuthbacteria bacterium]|nr:hypothetical protein [Candidatus Wildermuthbacteria bacterium]